MEKNVIAPLKEVQEVRNAIKAYECFDDFNAYDWKDLLKAHVAQSADSLSEQIDDK